MLDTRTAASGADSASSAGGANTVEEHHIPAADGGSIHCVSAGRGPTVLLAHGFLLDLSMYDPIFARLVERGYHVVAFDQRGHAGSRDGAAGCTPAAAVEDYRVLLDHFGADGTTLVGHSMGGFFSVLTCLRYPKHMQRLRRLVLLGANAGAVGEGSLPNKLQMPLIESGLMPKLWRMPRVGRALTAQLFGRKRDPEWVERTRQMLISQTVSRTLPLMRAMSNDNHYDRLHELTVETVVVCGDQDRTCPAWHSERLGREIPHAKNRWLPGVGHMLGYEAPEEVLAAITES